MTKYRRHTIEVISERNGLAVEVRNSQRRLVSALPVASHDEGISLGRELIDLRLGNR